MLIGVDFDNTLVCYDDVFHRAAVERGLIQDETCPSSSPDEKRPLDKTAIRDQLRCAQREDDWTRLQGYVYGVAIETAPPFAGAIDFFRLCRQRGVSTAIISHRTKTPYLGAKYDLHAAANDWLDHRGFFSEKAIGLDAHHVYWEETRAGKLARIASLNCTHFIDDLPEFLSDPDFPPKVERILFDPHRRYNQRSSHSLALTAMQSWRQIAQTILTTDVPRN